MEATKLSRIDIVKRANQLASDLLFKANVEEMCVDEGMSEKDAERMRKQVEKIAERLRRAQ